MANTYTLIASNTLSLSAASVTFSSIPGTYTDLVLKISARSDSSASAVGITYNSNTGTTHSRTLLFGNGTSALSINETGLTYVSLSYTGNPSTYTTSTFSNTEVYVPNYAGSTNKVASVFSTTENNSTTSFIGASAGLWQNTSAITQMVIAFPGGSNFVSGSSFWLYGIKKN